MNEVMPLVDILVEGGLARDEPGKYRSFVTVTATAENGDVMTGQMNPDSLRQMALSFLEVAEGSEQDRIVAAMLVRDVGVDELAALGFISGMRDERQRYAVQQKEKRGDDRESEIMIDDTPLEKDTPEETRES